jgi:ankyrin repeat protein
VKLLFYFVRSISSSLFYHLILSLIKNFAVAVSLFHCSMCCVRLLLDAGANINALDIDGWTPMHAAAHWGQGESCRQLSERMASLAALNKMV